MNERIDDFGVIIAKADLAGVFFALILGWLAGVLAAGLLSFYWLIRFRQLKTGPFSFWV